MRDIMVDLETTSVEAGHGAIIQLVGVRFDLETKNVDHNVFNRCMHIPPGRFWSEDTRQFWMQQKRSIIESIFQKMEDPFVVTKEFTEFCYPANSLRLWAKPSHFEFPFLSSYFKQYDFANPFHYREVMDMNSFIRGLYAPKPVPDLNVEFVGEAHDALYDTFHQIRVLFAHYEDAFK